MEKRSRLLQKGDYWYQIMVVGGQPLHQQVERGGIIKNILVFDNNDNAATTSSKEPVRFEPTRTSTSLPFRCRSLSFIVVPRASTAAERKSNSIATKKKKLGLRLRRMRISAYTPRRRRISIRVAVPRISNSAESQLRPRPGPEWKQRRPLLSPGPGSKMSVP